MLKRSSAADDSSSKPEQERCSGREERSGSPPLISQAFQAQALLPFCLQAAFETAPLTASGTS